MKFERLYIFVRGEKKSKWVKNRILGNFCF